MTLEEITNFIDQYRKKSEASLAQVAGAPAGTDFAEQLRTRLTSGEDISDLISNIAKQRSRLLAIPAETRAEMPIGVYSPTQVAGLISQRQEPVRATWETLMGVKQAREGRMEDIITRATQGYEAQIQKQQTKYDQERQKLQDLVQERNWIGQQAQLATQQTQYTAEQAEEKRRWEEEMKISREQLGLAQFKAGYGMPEEQTQQAQIKQIISLLPPGQQEGAFGAVASFQNAKDIIDLLNQGVSTGPIAGNTQLLAQKFGKSNPLFDQLTAAMTSFSANFIKGISGVAVSEQEYQRLMKALPSVTKQEGVNKNVLESLLNTIKNKYELQLNINFSDYPIAIPQINEIPVMEIETGETGWIPENEFDPSLYIKLE